MNVRKCKVMYGRDHLATLTVLPDGRWELVPTETHLPINTMQYVKLFDPYVGPVVPGIVTEWLRIRNRNLDAAEPIAQLIRGPHAPNSLWFSQEGR